jgi:hypothetical protein
MSSETSPVAAPCPHWCQLPAGHDWDDQWDDHLVRFHERTWPVPDIPGYQVELQQIERRTGGATTLDNPQVLLHLDAPALLALTAAAALCAAVDAAIRTANSPTPTPPVTREPSR